MPDLLTRDAGAIITEHFHVPLELNALDGDKGEFEGHAALFNVPNDFAEIVMPGSFKKSLRSFPKKRVKMLRQHSPSQIIGVWEHIAEDAKGLFVRGRLLTEVAAAAEAFILLKEGALDSLSIGFRTIVDEFDQKKQIRRLLEIQLFEISLVAIPAQLGALITSVRELGPEQVLTKRDLENALRDAGFSDNLTRYITAGWEPPAQRDAGGGPDVAKVELTRLLENLKTA